MVPTGFCESNDTTLPLCGLDGPEKTSPDETHIFYETSSSLLIGINATMYCLYIKWSPPRVSVNPMAQHSHCAELVAQRRPLQTKHAFSTKLEVHFYILAYWKNVTISCTYITWSPYGVL